MSKWKTGPLGDFVELKRGYDLPSSERQDGAIPIISSSGPAGYHSEARVEPPGVVTGRYGTLGEVFYVRQPFWPLNTTLYVRDFKGNDPRFVAYFFRGFNFEEFSDKAAVPGINRNHVHLKVVRFPPPDEQRAISRVLGALDDKIDLNRQMNETLDEVARGMFRSWFVDFDPVRARAEGQAVAGISAETAELFPARLARGARGELPQGWSMRSLSELTSKIGSGATPRGGEAVYVETGTALIRSQNVYDARFDWAGLARITDEAAAQLSGVSVQRDDVLLNITGASFLRTCVVDPEALPARVNQHVAIVRARAGIPPRYLHLWLLRPETKAYLAGMDAGGSRQAITKGHIESVPVLYPGDHLLARFAELTAPYFARIEANCKENRMLAALRDSLLPRLLSGELTLSSAPKRHEIRRVNDEGERLGLATQG